MRVRQTVRIESKRTASYHIVLYVMQFYLFPLSDKQLCVLLYDPPLPFHIFYTSKWYVKPVIYSTNKDIDIIHGNIFTD